MDFERTTAAPRLKALFTTIDAALDEAVRLVLFGGGAMTLRGLKDSTKDIDAVLTAECNHEWLRAALESANLAPADGYYLDGPLDPHTMFESDEVWLDLFLAGRIMGGLTWSPAFDQRADLWYQGRVLTVALADPTTIFLLKAVTGRWRTDRSRDLPDMGLIFERGLLDLEFLDTEWRAQCANHRDPGEVVELANEAIGLLAANGLAIPWDPEAWNQGEP